MNPTRTTRYRCGECGELHDFEDDATACCAPDVTKEDCWKCSECGYVTDDEDEARHCCLDEEVVLLPTPAQLEAAGQQRLLP